MAYHETYWTVAGTTAPVIALAAIVTTGQATDLIVRWRDEPPEQGVSALRAVVDRRTQEARTGFMMIAVTALASQAVAVMAQVLVLVMSLGSLEHGTDEVAPQVATFGVIAGMGFVLIGQVHAIFVSRFDRLARGRPPERPSGGG